ncbi:ABC transporter DrrB family efflux protein [Haloactinopolyspora alba]|uniref:Transport permease protein n=1 Tax=Haloactinopolyspora alba TaxID=648780 RepID=A0A2P8DFW0_9ACTN|nr:ABC transporter permease [Haloactinopolyspora alba]PSK96086.1 ABC transporter DrrB family efflux protein [Haloactinopolyspora alba]
MNSIQRTATPPNRVGLSQAVGDAMTIAWRNIRGGWRVPDNQIYMFIQPIMFVLLFAYVFGGAIPIPGMEDDPTAYKRYLMAGIFAQTMAFAVAPASVGLADDMQKGLIDRFRSLPMARSGVIAGRVIADLANQVIVLAIMIVCGLLVGWEIENGVLGFFGAVGLLLLFAFAMLWVGAFIGLSVGNPQVAASAGLIWLFPVVFLSNAFIPTPTLPGWLQPIAEWNPVSAFVAATRELFGNPSMFAADTFASNHPVLLSLIWVVVIVGIFAPLAVRKYKAAATK